MAKKRKKNAGMVFLTVPAYKSGMIYMNMKIREIKRQASYKLQGKLMTAMLAMLLVTVSEVVGGRLASVLFGGEDWLSLILGQIFVFIISLVTSVLSAGLCYMFLNMARGKEFSMGDLVFFFQNHPDRVIVAAFFLALINLIVSIPYYIYSLTAAAGETAVQQTNYLAGLLGFMVLSIVLNTIVTIPFAQTYYLMADQLNLEGIAALKESAAMMKGHFWNFFKLIASFVPSMILSVFTFYIALLWVMPFLQMSETVYYEMLLEQKREETGIISDQQTVTM